MKSLSVTAGADEFEQPLVRVVDLNIGETRKVTLHNVEMCSIELLDVRVERDHVMHAIRQVEVDVKINGQKATLVSGLYRLPRLVGGVQIDYPVTDNYNRDSHVNHWGIVKNARFRLWPKDTASRRPSVSTTRRPPDRSENTEIMKTLLAIGAHYDVCIFCVPGILLQGIRKHYPVVMQHLIGDYSNWPPAHGRAVAKMTAELSADHGVETQFLDFVSHRFDVQLDNQIVVVEAVAKIKPDVALALWKEDNHNDHMVASELSRNALRHASRILGDETDRPPSDMLAAIPGLMGQLRLAGHAGKMDKLPGIAAEIAS